MAKQVRSKVFHTGQSVRGWARQVLVGAMHLNPKFRGVAVLLLLLAVTDAIALAGTSVPSVAVVRSTAWMPGDATREGAAEMLVLLEIARVRHQADQAGLVAVGDRRGLFPAGAEEALREAVLRGLPVVKLASGGRVLPAPHGLFLDGGTLSAEEASRVLARCLELYGTLPPSREAGVATPQLRERLRQFQNELTLADSPRLAAR